MRYIDIVNKQVMGYYDDNIHTHIPITARPINDELYNILLTAHSVDVIEDIPERTELTIDDLDKFVVRTVEPILCFMEDDPVFKLETLQAKYDELEARFNSLLEILGGNQ